MVNLEDILKLVPASLRPRSGAVLYSGRTAFVNSANVYLLGLNPGGDPTSQIEETIGVNIDQALMRGQHNWSEYRDEPWAGREAGRYGMQPRILHMCNRLKIDPGQMPSSNVVFVRSRREAQLQAEKSELLRQCGPLHEAAISILNIRVVVALGGTAGAWVRDLTGANREIARFVEKNERRWTSTLHESASGMRVATLTHPSIAAWNVEATDPVGLVEQALTL